MFCTHCEFEIKGDDRKECPVCGGPLIDYFGSGNFIRRNIKSVGNRPVGRNA